MKKLSMILLTLLLAFGFTSAALANGGHGNDRDRSVTYDPDTNITTVVEKDYDVSYDKKVKVDKDTDYYSEKKYNKTSEKEVVVEVKKEKHPRKNWYREVTYEKTFLLHKITSWDEVTQVDTFVTYTTPIKITKTKVTTLKYKGKHIKKHKLISKDVQKYMDKYFGKTKKHVDEKKQVFKKNEKTDVHKKLLHVKKSVGKWMKFKHRH